MFQLLKQIFSTYPRKVRYTLNHDIYGTRYSNQTIINKDNVATLQVKWRLINDVEIQDPPIVIGNKGYVQDYAGNIIAFITTSFFHGCHSCINFL